MGNLYSTLLLPCVLLLIPACSDEAPGPAASNAVNNTFQPTGPTTCPTPVLSPVTTTLPPNDGQQTGGTNTTPDLSTSQNGFSLQGTNVFGTGEQTGQQGTSVFGSSQQAQTGQTNTGQVTSPGTFCPPVTPTVGAGTEESDNPQVQAMINPEEKKECNNKGKTWHWLDKPEGEKKGECLEAFNVQAVCDSQFYNQHFGKFGSHNTKVEMDGYLSSGYKPHQCGIGTSGGSYFSAAKVDLNDTGAEMVVKCICSQSECPCKG